MVKSPRVVFFRSCCSLSWTMRAQYIANSREFVLLLKYIWICDKRRASKEGKNNRQTNKSNVCICTFYTRAIVTGAVLPTSQHVLCSHYASKCVEKISILKETAVISTIHMQLSEESSNTCTTKKAATAIPKHYNFKSMNMWWLHALNKMNTFCYTFLPFWSLISRAHASHFVQKKL